MGYPKNHELREKNKVLIKLLIRKKALLISNEDFNYRLLISPSWKTLASKQVLSYTLWRDASMFTTPKLHSLLLMKFENMKKYAAFMCSNNPIKNLNKQKKVCSENLQVKFIRNLIKFTWFTKIKPAKNQRHKTQATIKATRVN